MVKSIRTRFAPSPTGHVHIGNIRVAIFNWLYARHTNGKFLLRIEDTDRERSTPKAIQTLQESMDWLGLQPDETPLHQSTRQEAHIEAAEHLLQKGMAYKDNLGSPEKGEAIVFKMPGTHISFNDQVKGLLTKKADDMKDLVIVRGNGVPVFHLANVLDDIHMGVNTVLRGDDHVENTFRHIALYQALGADIPNFAHLPMILNTQGKPYSKRDGDAYVGDFKRKEFLPEAIFNYLALLGWSPGDNQEIMTREKMIQSFSLDRIQTSPARMDLKKLTWMNGEYLRQVPESEIQNACSRKLKEKGWAVDEKYLHRVLTLIRERLKFPSEITTNFAYFFTTDFPYDEKAFSKRLRKEGISEILNVLKNTLEEITEFSEANIETALTHLAEEKEIKPGKLNPVVRISVTGQQSGASLFSVMELLGKEKILTHLSRTISYL